MSKKTTFSIFDGLRQLSVVPGAVFLGSWANIDHEKFLVVAGMDRNKILVCSVMINSRINQYILKRPKMLACQIELKAIDYQFLSHDSYANCAQPIKVGFDHFTNKELKYCGLLNNADLLQIQQKIKESGLLTPDEMAAFFR